MNNVMEQDIKKVLVSEEEIREKVAEIGARISEDYAGKNLLMVGILKGSVVFMADLMRAVTTHARIDFMSVSSYGSGTKSSGVVKIVKDLDIPTSLKEFGVPEEDLDSLVEAGMQVTRLLVNNMRQVTPADARALYQEIL